jgi:hypothetical protein
MFKKFFGNSFRITKAVQLCEQEFSIDADPARHFGTFTKAAGEYNDTLDQFISEHNPNDKELAIFLLAPAMESIVANVSHRALVRDVIRYWVADKEVRADIASMALDELA